MAAGGSVGSIYAEATLDVSGFVSAVGELTAASARMTAALGQASAGAMTARISLVSLGTAASSAASQLSGAAGAASSAGARFASGLAAGIASGRSAVISAAASLAAAAIGAAQAKLQIHSPSRVTMGFGENFDRGFVRGVALREPEVRRAVERVVTVTPAAANMARPVVNGIAAAPGTDIDYDRLAAANAARPAVLQLDGQTLAEVNARQEALAQNARTRRIAARYGG